MQWMGDNLLRSLGWMALSSFIQRTWFHRLLWTTKSYINKRPKITQKSINGQDLSAETLTVACWLQDLPAEELCLVKVLLQLIFDSFEFTPVGTRLLAWLRRGLEVTDIWGKETFTFVPSSRACFAAVLSGCSSMLFVILSVHTPFAGNETLWESIGLWLRENAPEPFILGLSLANLLFFELVSFRGAGS